MERKTKIRLENDIVYAVPNPERNSWRATFRFDGEFTDFVNATVLHGNSTIASAAIERGFELELHELDFVGGLCHVALKFRNKLGQSETIKAKVWQHAR